MAARVPPITIVQVLLNLSKGGLESMAVNLARGLDRKRFRTVVVATDSGGEHEVSLQEAGIKYQILGGRRLKVPKFHLAVAELFRKERAQVIHTHHFSPLMSAFPAAKLAGVGRLIHTEHSYEYLIPRRDSRFVLRWISRGCDAFVVVGNAMEPYYREQVKVPRNRLRVILNGVDVDRFRPTRDVSSVRRALGLPNGVLLGTAGRFHTIKRYDDLLEAMGRVAHRYPEAQLVMIGDGPERTRLERLAAALGLSGRVVFPGWQTDLSYWLSALDAFVLPSNSEGLPLAVLEAMATGLPVVTTSVGDLPEVVIDERSGFLVPVGDVAALADRLKHLLEDEARRRRMGKLAREEIKTRYSQRSMIDNYATLYDG